MSRPFTFKEFTIVQDNAAMKVGTDSVLLGAWIRMKEVRSILDIGCGTGLLSLMMAQRFQRAKITAIDIEAEALIDAKVNVDNSPWTDRIDLIEDDFLNYTFKDRFDLIISNPPYFPVDTHAPLKKRAIARNGMEDSLIDWLRKAKDILSHEGRIAFILPIIQWNKLKASLSELDLHILRIAYVRPKEDKDIHRVMLCLSMQEQADIQEEFLFIEKEKRHDYSDEYKRLTAAFYLDKS
jgi:tRNA1Val (adenine37-N6)-methyltransferase